MLDLRVQTLPVWNLYGTDLAKHIIPETVYNLPPLEIVMCPTYVSQDVPLLIFVAEPRTVLDVS